MAAKGAAADVITDVDFLDEMLEDAQLLVYGGTDRRNREIEPAHGIAGIQARKHLMTVKAQLDNARARLAEVAGAGDGSEEAFLADFDERLRNLPDPYLDRAMLEWLGRHPGASINTGEA